jgi:HEAT repeat protein
MRLDPRVLLVAALLGGACELEREQALRALASPDPGVRVEALRRLGESRDPSVADHVAPLLKDPSARVRRHAVAALGAAGARRHVHLLVERVHDADLEVRLAAVRVLGDTKAPRARAALLPALLDPSMVVRRAAVSALEATGMSRAEQVRELAKEELADQIARLRRADDQNRATAARLVGLSGRVEGVAPLLPLLRDRAPLVVTEAALALGRVGGAEARAALLRLVRSKEAVDRQAAAAGLGALGGPEAQGALSALLDDPSPAVRRSALAALAGVNGTSSARICAALLDEDRVVAAEAARLARRSKVSCLEETRRLVARSEAEDPPTLDVLALLTGPTVSARLLRVAQQLYSAYREESARWISPDGWRALGEPAPDPPPRVPAKGRPDPSKQAALERLLSRFPERRLEDPVEDPLMPPRTSDASVVAAIRGLAGRPQAHPWLAAVAIEAPQAVRVAALRALASPQGQGSAPGSRPASRPDAEPVGPVPKAIWIGLRSDQPAVRRAAADGCPLLEDVAAAAALRLLRERDFELRAAGARCLGALRDSGAVAALLDVLREDPQLAVIKALAQIGDHRATAAIAALLQDDHPADRQGERVAVVEALGELADPAAAPALERELAHPLWGVRRAAARALERSGRPASRDPLKICLGDYYAEVRRACQATLSRLR